MIRLPILVLVCLLLSSCSHYPISECDWVKNIEYSVEEISETPAKIRRQILEHSKNFKSYCF